MASVYAAGNDEDALRTAIRQLHTTIESFRSSMGKRTDIILVGDFNRHDQLWGGDEVTGRRQGEAGPIIDLMDEHGLLSLLPRGTKTWEEPGGESTIGLTLASAELADEMVCNAESLRCYQVASHHSRRSHGRDSSLARSPSVRSMSTSSDWERETAESRWSGCRPKTTASP